MENQAKKDTWAAVFVGKEATNKFTSEKTGRELVEVTLPEALPAGAPKIGGWHFYMPASCVRETKTGNLRLSFPPSWTSLRFMSPFTKGKRTETMEFPVEDAVALLQDSFNNHK